MSDQHLSWDGQIANEEGGFELLPAGKYSFQVVKLEKTTSNTSGAPMAVVTLRVETENGHAEFKDYLVLTVAAEWKLCAFFRAIGLKRTGEPFVMNWNLVEGSKGRAEITVEKYTKKNGDQGESNKVKAYIDAAVAGVEQEEDEDLVF
jgi:hypothetical protein